MSDAVVIVGGARTPMGGMLGGLSSVSAPELGAVAIREAISRANIAAADVDQVIMGNVLSAGLKQAPARQAALGAGIPDSAGCTTINKMCGSGMQATIMGHDQIKAGTNDVMVVGGMENMSSAPYLLPNARAGMRLGHSEVIDHMFTDGLEDAYTGKAMGVFAQEVADKYQLSREEMDQFAISSLTKAQAAIEQGKLDAETAKVTVKSRKGDIEFVHDEQPGNAKLDKIPKLRPAFTKDGTITAANSSSISDGASALVLMRESVAKAKGLKPLARIVSHATHSQAPELFTTAPIEAINKTLAKANWNKDDVDLFEINEAFAMVTLLAIKELGLDEAKVNVHGGACAQGHPIGSTGSRIIVSLIYALQQYGKKRGVAGLCIGGGEATAVALELI